MQTASKPFELIRMNAQKQADGSVVITRENGSHVGTYPHWHSSKPDYRFKQIKMNCFKWSLNWIKPENVATTTAGVP